MVSKVGYYKISSINMNILSSIVYTNGTKGMISMAVAVRDDYQKALEEQKKEVRNLVLEGLEQIKQGKTKDFNAVCDRLEKKYTV